MISNLLGSASSGSCDTGLLTSLLDQIQTLLNNLLSSGQYGQCSGSLNQLLSSVGEALQCLLDGGSDLDDFLDDIIDALSELLDCLLDGKLVLY